MTDDTKFLSNWVLWYHDPNDNDYSLKGYTKIGKITTPSEFWSLVNTISVEAWTSGMFFLMKEGFLPMWDAPENAKGGAWSKKVDAADTHSVFIDCMVHCLANAMLSKHQDKVVGVSVSPKGAFHIVKIWNTTTTLTDRKLFSPSLKFSSISDIAYKAHVLRPK